MILPLTQPFDHVSRIRKFVCAPHSEFHPKSGRIPVYLVEHDLCVPVDVDAPEELVHVSLEFQLLDHAFTELVIAYDHVVVLVEVVQPCAQTIAFMGLEKGSNRIQGTNAFSVRFYILWVLQASPCWLPLSRDPVATTGL